MSNGDVETVAAAIQSEGLNWTAGETALTGLTAEEQRQHLGLIVTREEHQQLSAQAVRVAAQEQAMLGEIFGTPAAMDWRNVGGNNYVTPIKNQGGCGSCVSFCSCSTIESAVRIKLANPNYNIDLSEGFLQFCGGGSCGGWGLTSGLDFAKSTGVTDEACMPYAAPPNMDCASKRCSDWQNRLTKISNYSPYSTMVARKDAIATLGPVLAGLRVYNDFFAYRSGVYVKTAGATEAGYHCICVVGYDDAQQCWILKNSWGQNWGDGGFVRIGYGQADLLLDTSWMFYSVDVQVAPVWQSNVTVTQVFATRDSQNAWAYFGGLGWRKIQPGAPDGVTNTLAVLAQAVAKSKAVNIIVDGSFVYQAYLL